MSTLRIGIVGAGMSGLGMLAVLRKAGFRNVVCYEQADEVGGTWRDNTYPGLSCDVPSRFYSYSFAPNPGWSQNFAPGAEIEAYFVRISRDLGLRTHIRFGTRIESAEWTGSQYAVRAADGFTDHVDVLISAVGVLRVPRYPDIPGLDTFDGDCFHSARWDHGVPLRGKRIAVIGTGSTGVQITAALAGVAAPLKLFCRTPQWIFPLPRLPYSRVSQWLLRRVPGLSAVAYRANQFLMESMFGHAVVRPGLRRTVMAAGCRANLRFAVRDRARRAALTPSDAPMCKRLIMSADFYPAVNRADVEVISSGIESVVPRGIRTSDGELHEVDTIVLATGFDAHAFLRPMNLVGENGITIDQAWRDGPRAYRTVAVPGFPNFFTLIGPHSPIGNHSLIAIAETQAEYVLRWVRRIAAERIAVAPTEEATAEFNAQVRAAMPNTVWVTGCSSWYLGPDGVPELFPWPPATHRAMLADPVEAHFTVR